MNILLFGKTGQVGWELQRALAPLGNLIAFDVHSTDYCGDFSNPEGVAETVRSIRPDIIVNAQDRHNDRLHTRCPGSRDC